MDRKKKQTGEEERIAMLEFHTQVESNFSIKKIIYCNMTILKFSRLIAF